MSEAAPPTERRHDLQVRRIFVEAYDILRPYFADKADRAESDRLAQRALLERFPHLTGQQVFIIVTAARRVFGSGQSPAGS